jgi:hypothetical protein
MGGRVKAIALMIGTLISTSAIAQNNQSPTDRASDWLIDDTLPPETGFKSDVDGKLTGCVPAPGTPDDQSFHDTCKKLISENKLARRLTPLHREMWISQATLTELSSYAPRGSETVFKLTVDQDGSVTNCEIIEGSGSVQVDQAVCVIISQKAQFIVSRDGTGNPRPAFYTNRVRWSQ